MTNTTAIEANACGEFPGYGPRWACATFGTAGHNYFGCPHCQANYAAFLKNLGVTRGAACASA